MKWSDLEIVEELGQGKAAAVWLARNNDSRTSSEHPVVALKRYKSWVLDERGQMERIVRELEIGRRVHHPNLLKTIGLLFDDQRKPVLVMKFYKGSTLDNYLKRRTYKVGIFDSLRMLGGLSGAIQALHDAGVIHRDVKPANVMVVRKKLILMDLGVSKPDDYPEQTTTNQFLGTIRYAAPEYLFGRNYDGRIDLYAFGLIAFELLCGRKWLGDVSQWASLVGRKYSFGGVSFREDCRKLSKSHDIQLAEFVNSLLTLTTSNDPEDRCSEMGTIYRAFSSKLWSKAFYVMDREFVIGEPCVQPLWCKDSDETDPVSLSVAIDRLREHTSSAQRKLLRSLMNRFYWNIEKSDIELSTARDIERKLVETGFFQFIGADSGDVWYRVDPIIKTAYRYGYL